jgi:hypothetical protein
MFNDKGTGNGRKKREEKRRFTMTRSGSFKATAALVFGTAILMSSIIAAAHAESFLATRTLVYKGTIKASKTIFNVSDTNNLLSASVKGYWVMTYSYGGTFISPFYSSRSVMYDARAKCYKKVYYEIQTEIYDPCHVVLYHFDATDVNGRLTFDVVGKGKKERGKYPVAVYTPVTLKGTGFVENFRFFDSDVTYTGPVTVTMTLCRKLMDYQGEPDNSEGYAGDAIYNAIIDDMAGKGWTDLNAEMPAPNPEKQKLLASDGTAGDGFGYSVCVSADYAIVGAGMDDDDGAASGSACIYAHDGLTWKQKVKLTAPDADADDYFGMSVAIDGDYAIVGAPHNDIGVTNCGSAYIFACDGTAWTRQAELFALDGQQGDYFGCSVSISGDYALVGADGDTNFGAAYIFKRDGLDWGQQAKLVASDGNTYDRFGTSVCISGDFAIIGATGDDDKGPAGGSAFIFVRDGLNWFEQAKLLAPDGAANDRFGTCVSISGNYAIAGAPGNDNGGKIDSGSAYIFEWDGVTWSQKAKLAPAYAASHDFFGHSVSICGDVVVIGSTGDSDNGPATGSAYIFTRNGSTWSQQKKLTANAGDAGDCFGVSVSISGNYVIAGAGADDDNGADSGSAYIFEY